MHESFNKELKENLPEFEEVVRRMRELINTSFNSRPDAEKSTDSSKCLIEPENAHGPLEYYISENVQFSLDSYSIQISSSEPYLHENEKNSFQNSFEDIQQLSFEIPYENFDLDESQSKNTFLLIGSNDYNLNEDLIEQSLLNSMSQSDSDNSKILINQCEEPYPLGMFFAEEFQASKFEDLFCELHSEDVLDFTCPEFLVSV